MEVAMPNLEEFEAMIPNLPLSDRVAMRDRLDESIEESLSISHSAMEQTDFDLMERRLNDYESGLVQGLSWEDVEARIRQQLKL